MRGSLGNVSKSMQLSFGNVMAQSLSAQQEDTPPVREKQVIEPARERYAPAREAEPLTREAYSTGDEARRDVQGPERFEETRDDFAETPRDDFAETPRAEEPEIRYVEPQVEQTPAQEEKGGDKPPEGTPATVGSDGRHPDVTPGSVDNGPVIVAPAILTGEAVVPQSFGAPGAGTVPGSSVAWVAGSAAGRMPVEGQAASPIVVAAAGQQLVDGEGLKPKAGQQIVDGEGLKPKAGLPFEGQAVVTTNSENAAPKQFSWEAANSVPKLAVQAAIDKGAAAGLEGLAEQDEPEAPLNLTSGARTTLVSAAQPRTGSLAAREAFQTRSPVAEGAKMQQPVTGAEARTGVVRVETAPQPKQAELTYLRETLLQQVANRTQIKVNQATQEVRIFLKPESLGSLTIKLSVADQQVRGAIMVQSQAVKEIVEQNLNSLKEAFKGHGLETEGLTVTVDENTDPRGQFAQSQWAGEEDQALLGAYPASQPEAEGLDGDSLAYLPRGGGLLDGRVDLFA